MPRTSNFKFIKTVSTQFQILCQVQVKEDLSRSWVSPEREWVRWIFQLAFHSLWNLGEFWKIESIMFHESKKTITVLSKRCSLCAVCQCNFITRAWCFWKSVSPLRQGVPWAFLPQPDRWTHHVSFYFTAHFPVALQLRSKPSDLTFYLPSYRVKTSKYLTAASSFLSSHGCQVQVTPERLTWNANVLFL